MKFLKVALLGLSMLAGCRGFANTSKDAGISSVQGLTEDQNIDHYLKKAHDCMEENNLEGLREIQSDMLKADLLKKFHGERGVASRLKNLKLLLSFWEKASVFVRRQVGESASQELDIEIWGHWRVTTDALRFQALPGDTTIEIGDLCSEIFSVVAKEFIKEHSEFQAFLFSAPRKKYSHEFCQSWGRAHPKELIRNTFSLSMEYTYTVLILKWIEMLSHPNVQEKLEKIRLNLTYEGIIDYHRKLKHSPRYSAVFRIASEEYSSYAKPGPLQLFLNRSLRELLP